MNIDFLVESNTSALCEDDEVSLRVDDFENSSASSYDDEATSFGGSYDSMEHQHASYIGSFTFHEDILIHGDSGHTSSSDVTNDEDEDCDAALESDSSPKASPPKKKLFPSPPPSPACRRSKTTSSSASTSKGRRHIARHQTSSSCHLRGQRRASMKQHDNNSNSSIGSRSHSASMHSNNSRSGRSRSPSMHGSSSRGTNSTQRASVQRNTFNGSIPQHQGASPKRRTIDQNVVLARCCNSPKKGPVRANSISPHSRSIPTPRGVSNSNMPPRSPTKATASQLPPRVPKFSWARNPVPRGSVVNKKTQLAVTGSPTARGINTAPKSPVLKQQSSFEKFSPKNKLTSATVPHVFINPPQRQRYQFDFDPKKDLVDSSMKKKKTQQMDPSPQKLVLPMVDGKTTIQQQQRPPPVRERLLSLPGL